MQTQKPYCKKISDNLDRNAGATIVFIVEEIPEIFCIFKKEL